MPTQIDVFISSKMQELKAERQVVYDLLSEIKIADIRLQAWVFEQDAPASLGGHPKPANGGHLKTGQRT